MVAQFPITDGYRSPGLHRVSLRLGKLLIRLMNDAPETAELRLELRDLKQALAALRERLELAQEERDAALVRAVSEANAEIAQLKNTIGSLRDELEAERGRREDLVRAAVTMAQDEIGQLQATVRALRDKLETTSPG